MEMRMKKMHNRNVLDEVKEAIVCQNKKINDLSEKLKAAKEEAKRAEQYAEEILESGDPSDYAAALNNKNAAEGIVAYYQETIKRTKEKPLFDDAETKEKIAAIRAEYDKEVSATLKAAAQDFQRTFNMLDGSRLRIIHLNDMLEILAAGTGKNPIQLDVGLIAMLTQSMQKEIKRPIIADLLKE